MKYPSLNLYISDLPSSSIILLPFHLWRVLVISTNSFWEFNIPKARVYRLFLGDIALVPLVFLRLVMSPLLHIIELYTANLSPACRELSSVNFNKEVSAIKKLRPESVVRFFVFV